MAIPISGAKLFDKIDLYLREFAPIFGVRAFVRTTQIY